MIKECKKCGSKNLYLEPRIKGQDIMSAAMVSLKCKDCKSWLKWCPKDERQFYINKKQDNKIEEFWVIQRDDRKLFCDIDIEENEYKPYFTEHIEHCISNHSTFRTKELAQSYINKFLQNCRPVKVEIKVVGE